MALNIDLATKYRSKKVEEYIGNEFAKTQILNNFKEEPYPSVILIDGDSGCGKTTLARLTAKLVFCENKQTKEVNGVSHLVSCNECESCQIIDECIEKGDSEASLTTGIYTELDATQSRKVSEIDSFIEEFSIPPMYGYQFHIIDECHMINETAQNSLLKFFEDVPERSIFVLCTTDPQKMLKTLVNRCRVKIHISKPTTEEIIENLQRVCDAEHFSYTVSGLRLIAERSDNVHRTSLINLSQVLVASDRVDSDTVSKALDIQNEGLFFDFLGYLLKGNSVMYMHLLYEIRLNGKFSKFVDDLNRFVKRGLYIRTGITPAGLTNTELKRFKSLFAQFSLEEIYGLLTFLDTVSEGDIETRLITLGYRGLKLVSNGEQMVSTKEQPTQGIEVKENDLRDEAKIQQALKEHKRSESISQTGNKAQELLKDLDPSDLANSFGL